MSRLWRNWFWAEGLAAAVLLPAAALAQTGPWTINTVAGNQGLGGGYSGDGAAAVNAQLGQPVGLVVDKSGNIFIADQTNHVIREVTTDGNIKTIAGNHLAGYLGDGAAATSAEMNKPLGLAMDSSGNLYLTDSGNEVIRKFSVGGNISTVAGSYTIATQVSGSPLGGYQPDNGVAANAWLNNPFGIAVDGSGNIYIADTLNHIIRMVNGTSIKTIAGQPGLSGSNDTGNALQAHLNGPRGIALDASGNLYIADTTNNKVLKLSGGALTTVAGIGTGGFSGDNGPANQAQLFAPRAVAVDSAGNVYIADYTNQRIRMVSPNGIITTIAGNGKSGYGGDAGPGTSATLSQPSGLWVDSKFNVYVADTNNNVIRTLTPASTSSGGGTPPAIRTSQGVIGASGFGAFPSTAPGSWIEIYGSNLAPDGDSRSWQGGDFNGITAPQQLDRTSVTIGTQAAYVAYISPTQVNVQVPSTVGTGPQPVTVSTAAGTSAAFNISVTALDPALLALPTFQVGGKQYVTATFLDGVTFVGPTGAFPGFTSRPAKPGDTIVLYGIGFGPVSGNIPAGQIVQQINSLTNNVQFQLNGTPAPLGYYGLAPQEVGVYQFNLTVPTIGPGDAALTYTLGPNTINQQTLYVTIGN
jgi:uncharacterized protein (TIGR03437 family)